MANPLQALRDLFPGIGVEGKSSPMPAPGAAVEPGANPPAEPQPVTVNLVDPTTGLPVPVAAAPGLESGNQEPKDPLAHFADLFDNKKQEANQVEPSIGATDLFTSENMGKIMESLPNFTDHITDETREALAKGEDPQAIMKAFDEIGKGAYSTALQHSVKLSESLTSKQIERMEASFSERINQHQVSQSISQHELIKDSPVLQAGISIIAERLQKTNPTAAPDWITKQATKYFLDSAALLTGNKPGEGIAAPAGPKPAEPSDVNWVDFANDDGSNPIEGSGEAQ